MHTVKPGFARTEGFPQKWLPRHVQRIVIGPDDVAAHVLRSLEQGRGETTVPWFYGPLAPLPCASETRLRKCDECVDIESCGTRMVLREVRDAIADILDNTTLAMVCRKVDAAREVQRAPEAFMYEI